MMRPSAGRLLSACRRTGLALAGFTLALRLAAQTDFSRDTIPTPSPMPRAPRAMICFPPFPPALDQPINRLPATPAGQGTAPAALAPYVSELFYPQLSTHFAARSLSEKQQQQLGAYRAAKLALAQELHDLLASVRDTEPAARRQACEALARRQAPRFEQLEKSAELLRVDLIAADRNWSEYREWKLSDRDRRGYSPVEIAQVMRAFAYYQKGLLPAQRRLLREIALELAQAVDRADKATAAGNAVFFSPETARVTIPDMLPEIAAKFATFLTRKSALKKELYDAVHKFDGEMELFNSTLRALPEKQAARFAQLEVIAEEIRVGLGPVTPPGDPLAKLAIPNSVVERINGVIRDRQQLQQAATAKVEAIVGRTRAARIPVSVNYAFEKDRLRTTVYPALRGTPPANLAAQMESLRTELGAVSDQFGRGLADLVNRNDEIRREVAELLGITAPQALDLALANAMRAAAQRESEGAYRDYRIAVFEPGLSLEQRRLLFDGSIEQLGLPLPRGEMQPSRRANSW